MADDVTPSHSCAELQDPSLIGTAFGVGGIGMLTTASCGFLFLSVLAAGM